jgi:hypothetical protein
MIEYGSSTYILPWVSAEGDGDSRLRRLAPLGLRDLVLVVADMVRGWVTMGPTSVQLMCHLVTYRFVGGQRTYIDLKHDIQDVCQQQTQPPI